MAKSDKEVWVAGTAAAVGQIARFRHADDGPWRVGRLQRTYLDGNILTFVDDRGEDWMHCQVLASVDYAARVCPRCGQPGQMFTSDLDRCLACQHLWEGT